MSGTLVIGDNVFFKTFVAKSEKILYKIFTIIVNTNKNKNTAKAAKAGTEKNGKNGKPKNPNHIKIAININNTIDMISVIIVAIIFKIYL